jgi:hypothetical protein
MLCDDSPAVIPGRAEGRDTRNGNAYCGLIPALLITFAHFA